jgi:23S rRNA pseudouridine1911/1915/1917 synthase
MAKKIIFNGAAGIVDKRSSSSTLVHKGDQVFVDLDKVRSLIIGSGDDVITAGDTPVHVIYEDESTIAVNKPSGMVVHPVYQHLQDTLLHAVNFHIIHYSANPFAIARPVHRLDQGTSGVVLFSKNLEAHNFYSRQFRRHEIAKEYIALVSGDFRSALAEDSKLVSIENHISKQPLNRKYYAGSEGDLAQTDIYFERYATDKSYLRVVPHTGRTHQIRVHLSELGFPIIGDKIYGGLEGPRLMLHAWKLTLKLLSGETKELLAPPPSEFLHDADKA